MLKTSIAVMAAGIATAASVVSLGVVQEQRTKEQQNINVAVCRSVVNLDGAITHTLERSLVTLPKISYYQEHPAELARQKFLTQQALKEFIPPKSCSSLTH